MARLVVTGAASPLGRRVAALLAERDDVTSVVAVDLRAADAPGVELHRLDLATADLTASFEGADGVLHLASVFGPAMWGPEIADAVEVTLARRVLAAADKAGAERVVLISSATVYGPWANNAVPLTEEAPLRPHPGLSFAVQKAEIERLAADWAADHPSATVARLRPATTVHEGAGGWLAEALHAASRLPTGDDTPAQYLHLDDLASAVVAAWASGLQGPVNVAPDGWLTPTERKALDPVPKLRLPERVAVAVANWRWRLRLAPTPPGILAYARHPWVVANDRLAETGWTASHSNEEAYVAGHEARAIESISPQKRQELALGVTGVALAGTVAGVVALVRRRRQR
ncbi:NAD-dependent epimerase/dehydratase family protein [Aquihabitans sp. G128]|uniref:NAD-dependent epimerase/dehydratase family protein n=1 Tax=Aquihabitans sp. G128 TaxID=2849779 RepID=UPI001C24714F|nr:NAD-dependent epimerase/dehydratase family protein [Aquihabitans sp. G128]QXC60454.1 NAD-dependent epimerase/dehydratase family protein [Aquihabitans sp. G128]